MNHFGPSHNTLIDIGSLPPLPHVLLKLAEICNQAEPEFSQLAHIASQDAALTVKILDLAHAGIADHQYASLELSVLLRELGVGVLASVVSNAITREFFSASDKNKLERRFELWKQSLGCALRSRALATAAGYSDLDEAFLAGLLHNVDQLIDLQGNPAALADGMTLEDGSVNLLEQLGMTASLVDAVLYQNEDINALLDAHPLVKIVNLAVRAETDPLGDDEMCKGANKLLGILRMDLRELLQQAELERETVLQEYALANVDDRTESFNKVRIDLARKVREYGLLSGVACDLAGAAKASRVTAAVERQMKLLLGIHRVLILRYFPDEAQLCAWPGKTDTCDSMGSMKIAMASGRSLMADALLQREILHSFMPDITSVRPVVDRQLARLLQGRGLLCVPMFIQGKRAGVLVAGIDREQKLVMERRFSLLSGIAGQAAAAMQKVERMDALAHAGRTA